MEVLTRLGLTPMTYVVACMNDKDARGMMRALAPTARRIMITQVDIARSAKASEVAAIAEEEFSGPIEVFSTPQEALNRALKKELENGVCVIGSFYLAGDAIKWLEGDGHMPRRPRADRLAHKV